MVEDQIKFTFMRTYMPCRHLYEYYILKLGVDIPSVMFYILPLVDGWLLNIVICSVHIMILTHHQRENIYSQFSRSSETFASEFSMKKLPRYYMQSPRPSMIWKTQLQNIHANFY